MDQKCHIFAPKVQNENIAASNSKLSNKVPVIEISAACFLVVANEKIDIFSVKQFSISIIYVHEDKIRENFLKFKLVMNVTGQI
jgi:hypothetical protein